MISIPEEIMDVIDHDSDGNMMLNKSATQEQIDIFEQFMSDLETGDMNIKFEI